MFQLILEEKVILNQMVQKIIYHFSQCTDIIKSFAGFGSDNYMHFWKSKGSSDENITAPNTTNYRLNPQ